MGIVPRRMLETVIGRMVEGWLAHHYPGHVKLHVTVLAQAVQDALSCRLDLDCEDARVNGSERYRARRDILEGELLSAQVLGIRPEALRDVYRRAQRNALK